MEVERLRQMVVVLVDRRVLGVEVGVRHLGGGGRRGGGGGGGGGGGSWGRVVEVSILQDLCGSVGQPHLSHYPQLQLVASGPAISAGEGEGPLGHR